MTPLVKIPKELKAPKRNSSLKERPVGEHYATQVTVDSACRCPHLDAYLPKYLDSGSLGLYHEQSTLKHGAKRQKRLTVSDLHLSSILPNSQMDFQKRKMTSDNSSYNFGDVEKKTDMILCDGTEYFSPLFPPTFVNQVKKEREFEMQQTKLISIDKSKESATSFHPSKDGSNNGADLEDLPMQKLSPLETKSEDAKAPQSKTVSSKEIKSILPLPDIISDDGAMDKSLELRSAEKVGLQSKDLDSFKRKEHSHEEWQTTKKQREIDIQAVVTRTEIWLETIRQNRLKYWSHQLGSQDDTATFQCKRCVKSSLRKRSKSQCILPTGDSLMQCLDCSAIFCGAESFSRSSSVGKRHMQQHFLLSNHQFAITCGEKGEIFCMKCGDFVYNCEPFENEKSRVEIEANIPWFSWDRRRILQRGFAFREAGDEFYVIPSGADSNEKGAAVNGCSRTEVALPGSSTVVWKGFQATYPPEVSYKLIMAAQKTLHRSRLFRGDLLHMDYLKLDKTTSEFALRQRNRGQRFWTIDCPVGIYNAGNTCYISSVVQCIFNLRPVQEFFLCDIKHDYRTCEVLRSSSSQKSSAKLCLACEIDKLMLKYYGSTVGLDICKIINPSSRSSQKLEMAKKINSTSGNSFDSNTGNDVVEPIIETIERGMPIVVSDFLATAWNLKDMAALAGNEQHDSHEFMQVFLDIVDKDCKRFEQAIISSRKAAKQTWKEGSSNLKPQVSGTMTSLFSGNLRSVLMCDKCGFKRTHTEPFLNVSLSLPLGKSTNPGRKSYSDDSESMGTRRRGQKIDVRTCIDHFSDPEPLVDGVFCDWCRAKTKTRKQHTFAKLPTILCLHLKRFNAATNKKIDEPVSFPSTLDMGPYLPHWREVEQTDVLNDASSKSTTKIIEHKASSPSMLYDLCGTINHSGTLFQGHYVSNVKVNDDWYSCNDSEVYRYSKENAEKEVLKSEEAYMLFYMRKMR